MTNSDTEFSHREVNQTFKKKFLCECAQGSKCGRKFCSFSSRVNESIHGKKNKEFFPGKHSIGSSPAVKQVVNKCKQWLLSPRQRSNVTGKLQPALCTGTILQLPTGQDSFFTARYKIQDKAAGHKQTVPLTVHRNRNGEKVWLVWALPCASLCQLTLL